MKKHSLLLLFLIISTTVCAGPIDAEQAKSIALQFMHTHLPGTRLEADTPAYAPTRKRLDKDARLKELPAYYVFNTEAEEGYVIVAADDRTDAIIGYATSGRFNADSMPPNVKEWMNNYTTQIALIDTYTATTKHTATGRPAIAPMLTTQWNQDAPYNQACPTQGASSTYTGCTATAMAQVMKYHEWPKAETSAIPAYTTATAQIYLPELQPTIFDWDAMQDNYAHSDYAPAVAELMLYCGQALQSDFTKYATSAYLTDAPTILTTMFGYDANIDFLYQADHTISEWEALIYAELEAGRPVLHAGTSLGGGHAFVCDGYDGEGMFHFNWGWGGMYDGYYKLSLLKPGTDGIGAGTEDGFSANQRIVVGIQPPTGYVAPLKPFTTHDLQLSGTNLYCNFQNPNSKSATMNVGFATVDEQGEIIALLKDCGAMTLKGYNLEKNWGTLILGTNGEVSLSPGWHRIAGVCQSEDGTWIQGGSKQTYFEIKIGADNMPDSLVLHPIVKAEITEFECISGKVVGTRQKVRITINNQGDDTNSMLYFYASQSDLRETPLTRIPLLLHRGETATFDVTFFTENTGTYYLYLATTDDGIDYVAKTEVDIIPAPQGPARLELTACTIAPDSQSAQIIVRNHSDEPYHREIVAQLYEELYNDGNYYYIRSTEQQGTIAPHSTKTFNFQLEGIKAHRNYYLYIGHYLLHTDEFTTQLGTSLYFNSSTTGIAPISPAPPAQTQLYQINGKRANTSAPRGIYIMNGKKFIAR